ncbi:MAG: radical SAM protein [Thermodesulfobacteriota bacterium]
MALRLPFQGGPLVSPAVIVNYLRYKLRSDNPRLDLKTRPIICTLVATVRCNLKCPFCIVPAAYDDSSWEEYEASVPKVIRILDHPLARRALYVGLTGGEPLMVDDLPGLVRLIRRRGHLCGVVTNGLLLGGQIRELKKSGLNVAAVSIYDLTLPRLQKIMPAVNSVFRCRANKILTRGEVENRQGFLEEVIRFSRDGGFLGLYFGNFLPQGTGTTDEVIYEDHPACADFRKRMTAKYAPFPIYWPKPHKRNIGPGDKKCRLPWYYIIVGMTGNLGLCNQHMPPPDGRYGNLFASSAAESVNHPSRLNMRLRIKAADGDVPEPCLGCPIMGDDWHAAY